MPVTVGTFNLNNLFSRFDFSADVATANASNVKVDERTEFSFDNPVGFKLRTYKCRLIKGKSDGDPEKQRADKQRQRQCEGGSGHHRRPDQAQQRLRRRWRHERSARVDLLEPLASAPKLKLSLGLTSAKETRPGPGSPVGCVNPIGPSQRRILAGPQTRSEPWRTHRVARSRCSYVKRLVV